MSRARRWGQNVTKGGVELLKWIKAHGLSIPRFAERFALSRLTLQRYINGEPDSIPVEFAQAVYVATDGAIELAWWAEKATAPTDDEEDEKATGTEGA